MASQRSAARMETRQREPARCCRGAGEEQRWLGLGRKWGRQGRAVRVRRFAKNHGKLRFPALQEFAHTQKQKQKKG